MTRVWILGEPGVGKKSFAKVIGAMPAKSKFHEAHGGAKSFTWRPMPSHEPAEVMVSSDLNDVVRATTNSDVLVLMFDLTRKTTFSATIAQWSQVGTATFSSNAQVLLVGSKLNQPNEREVLAAEAMELALVECNEYVEVCATQAPFEGVQYARELLMSWLSAAERRESVCRSDQVQWATRVSDSSAETKQNEPSRRKRCVRTSIWLYDPTEEEYAAAVDDVKLRPISQALFQIRQSGSDKSKSQERKREQSVSKGVIRSRYYGPTESSRHMRWQAQQKVNKSERRRGSGSVDIQQEHARLQAKSFSQPTKLMEHRLAELRERVVAAKSFRESAFSGVSPIKHTTLKSVQAAKIKKKVIEAKRVTRPDTCSVAKPTNASKISRSDRVWHELPLSADALVRPTGAASPSYVAEHATPSRTPVPVTEQLPSRSSSRRANSRGEEFDGKSLRGWRDDAATVATSPRSAAPWIDSDNDESDSGNTQELLEDESRVESSDIDDILDYFDGVSLPI